MFDNVFGLGAANVICSALQPKNLIWGVMHPKQAFSSTLNDIARYAFKQAVAGFALVAPEQYKLITQHVSPAGAGISTSVITAAIASFVFTNGLPGTGLALSAVSATSAYVTHKTYTSEEHKLKLACELLKQEVEVLEKACEVAKVKQQDIEYQALIMEERASSIGEQFSKLKKECFNAATKHRPTFEQLNKELNSLNRMIVGKKDRFDVLEQLGVVKGLVETQLQSIGV